MLDALLALSLVSMSVWSVQQLLAQRVQQAQQQRHRANAMALLDDLAQRIRIHTSRFGYASAQQRYGQRLQAITIATGQALNSCQTSICNAQTFAQWVLATWTAAAYDALPGAQLGIEVQGQRLRLLLAWPQVGSGSYKWQSICPAQYDCEVLWL
ncbi:hypothetical protein LN050_04770 [Comamonadaceae bacterium M7527]|nr:hypothetical protein LN050_04770 [Comamonadaceae bacterium M7527]